MNGPLTMKKLLKSLKRSFYDDCDDSKNEKDATTQDKGKPYFWRRKIGNSNCRLFLGGFPDDVTESEVKKAFEKYGKVVDIMIPIEKCTNKLKRYGFLEFLNEESAKKCLEDRFVSVNGKKVEVKMAWARGNSEKGEKNCDKEAKEMSNNETFPSSSADLDSLKDRSVGSSCTDTESSVGDGKIFYQKLFENYFKAKFCLENLLNLETVNDAVSKGKVKNQQYDEKEMEKILSGLHVSIDECSSEEDTGDFSSDSEETQSFVGELEYFSVCDSVGPIRPNQTDQTIPLPRTNEERIVCDLCEWAPLDNSAEGFLAHCRTSAHKQKLRERFRIKETPDRPQNKVLTSAMGKTFPKNTNRRRRLKYQNPPNESSSECQENQKNRKNTKLILEEVLPCVKTTRGRRIKCTACEKTIPHAPDIRILMANLSQHIQSKGHLAKITAAEKPVQGPENAHGKNVRGCAKEKTAPMEKTHKTAHNNENLAGAAKHPKAELPNKSKHTAKQLLCKSESAPQLNAANSNTKVRFRCLTCNYFCSQTKTFLTHLTSQLHAANEKQTSSKSTSESSYDNFTNCSNCSTLLHGNLDCIKNHVAKCKKPK